MSRLVSTLLYEFWCHIPSRTRVFLDPLWPLLTIFPINRLVLYSIFFFLLLQPSLLLSHASSVLVLITAALFTFFVYGCQCSSNRVGDYEKDLGR